MSAYISYRNLADSAILTAPGQTVITTLANMQNRQLANSCAVETSGVSDPIDLRIDRGASAGAVLPGICALVGINAQFTAGLMMIVETGADGITWSLLATTGSAFGDAGVSQLPNSLISPFSGTVQRYIRVRGYWTRTDKIRKVGRLWFGPAIVLPLGVDGNYDIIVNDTGDLDSSAGGQWYESPRVRTRSLRLSCSPVGSALAFGFDDSGTSASDVPSFQGLQMDAGATGEVIVLPKSDSNLWIRRLGIYGHLDRPPSIRRLAGPNYSTELTVIEER